MSATQLPLPPFGTTDPLIWQNYYLAFQNYLASLVVPPIDAQYWVSTVNSELTAERNLGALATGYLTITTVLGVATPSTVTTIPASALTGTLGVTHGGTGTATAFTLGSVVFAGAAGVYAQDNAHLFWDAANAWLGIGTNLPTQALTINGNLNLTTTNAGIGIGPYRTFTIDAPTIADSDGDGLLIQAAAAVGAGVYGGNIALFCGASAYVGGTLSMTTGSASVNTGAAITMTGADDYADTAGGIRVTGGNSSTGLGGSGDFAGGVSVDGQGGYFTFIGGNSTTGSGGQIYFQGGNSASATGGTGGVVYFLTGGNASGASGSMYFQIGAGATPGVFQFLDGNMGVRVTVPTAYLHLAAGTATAGTAPEKMTSGTLLTTPEAGAREFLTDKWYGTITTGPARKEFTLNDSALTAGRVPYVTTNGRLTDAAGLTYVDADGLGVGVNFGAGLAGTRVTVGDAGDLSGYNMGVDANNRAFLLWDNTAARFTLGTREAGVTFGDALLVKAGIVRFGAQVRLAGYTVATLPAGPVIGDTAYATDLLLPAFYAAAAGGGAVKGPVFYNGAAWITV